MQNQPKSAATMWADTPKTEPTVLTRRIGSTTCKIVVHFNEGRSYKHKQIHFNERDKWAIFENTHEAIVTKEVWELANKLRSSAKRHVDRLGAPRPLTGLVYCAQCGAKMYHSRSGPNAAKHKDYYTCSNYSAERAGNFLKLARRYRDFSELSPKMINEFVGKVLVHEKADKGCRITKQTIEIHLSFIGNFFVPRVLDPAAEAERLALEADAAKRREYQRNYRCRRQERGGRPLTETTPEEHAAWEAEREEKRKSYHLRIPA